MAADLGLYEIEATYFASLNRELYQTKLTNIEERLSALSPSNRERPEVIVCFVIAFMRLGLHSRAADVGKDLLFDRPTHILSLATCHEAVIALANALDGDKTALAQARILIAPLHERLHHLPTASLHANWYVFAWYEYLSALNLALMMTLRALERQDDKSLGRCISYLGLSCGLIGFYDLACALSERGYHFTKERLSENFAPYWSAEAAAICATTLFYAGRWQDARQAGALVSCGDPAPALFPFAHIYTDTILMRVGLDGFAYSTFKEAVGRLQRLLGNQFDSRYSVQSHYCSAIFLLLHGQEQEAIRNLAVARASNSKDANRFRSINHSHCLTYEARSYFLMGYFRDAVALCRKALADLPEGSIDGRHALEILMLLWRILILMRSPLLDEKSSEEERALELQIAIEVEKRTRFGTTSWQRYEVYLKLSREIEQLDPSQLFHFAETHRTICPSEHADIVSLVARASIGNLRPHANLQVIANVSDSINYVEVVSNFVRELNTNASSDERQALEDFSRLAMHLTRGQGATLHSGTDISDTKFTTRQFSEHLSLLSNDREESLLRVTIRGINQDHTIDIVEPSVDLAYDRHVLDAIHLAKTSFEGHLRIVELAAVREREAQLAIVAKTTAMLAHDVRAPFSSLQSVLLLIKRGRTDPNFIREATEFVEKKLSNVNDLLHDVLDATRPTIVSPEPLYFAGYLKECLEQCFRSFSIEKNHQLTYKLQALQDPCIDRARFQRVVTNIVTNAAQMAEAGSTIHFATEDVGAFVRIKIHNSGTSLSEADLPQLFHSFYSRRRGGTGLGLAIAHKIVTAHGGTIRAINEENGVAFYIELPAKHRLKQWLAIELPTSINALRARVEPLRIAEPHSEVSDPSQILSLLVVDDDSIYRALIGDLLHSSRLPVRIYEASSYDEAIRLLVERPQITHVIADFDLSGARDGADLVQEAVRLRPELHCLVHSNRLPELLRARLNDTPVRGIVGKPMTLQTMRRFLDGQEIADHALQPGRTS